jgi:hypothetical protein
MPIALQRVQNRTQLSNLGLMHCGFPSADSRLGCGDGIVLNRKSLAAMKPEIVMKYSAQSALSGPVMSSSCWTPARAGQFACFDVCAAKSFGTIKA